MKKHRILTVVLLSMCMGALPIQVFPYSVPDITANAENTATIEYNSMIFEIREDKPNELILTSYSGEEADLTVPETIGGKTVTGIANGTFVGNQIIKNVILPDTIDYFGNCVFFDCSLETINIPKSLRVIPNQTFQNCKNLKSVEFHDNILCIAKTAFYHCPLELPENLKDKCINRKIFTSETVEYEDMIFAVSKENVDELILISYNENEENLTIPETIDDKNVTAIMGNLFKVNKKIKNITLPDTVYYLETGTFADSSVETINIPKMLIIIPDYTFKNCTNLKSVAFHDKVIFVSKNAFENTSVNVPNHINSELTFENSAKYDYEYENFNIRIYLDENNDYSVGLLSTKIPKEKAQNMVLPETIYGLPVTAFNYPDRNNQGDGFSRYSSVCGYDENDNWYSYSIQPIQYILNMQNDGIGINSVEFPKYFNNINTSAFQNHTELKEIIINSTDVKITDNAFENTGIERLEMHNPKQIGKSSFAGCTELKNITFDECSGDLLIDKNAFSGCENLQTLTIEGNPETLTINDYAFKNCNSLEKITIPKTCKNLVIGRSALKDTQIKEIETDEDCTIGIDAFAGCPLESVIINSENAEIKLGAFDNCKNLKELKLSKGCNLSANSFMNCTALENINIDTSGKVFGNNAEFQWF